MFRVLFSNRKFYTNIPAHAQVCCNSFFESVLSEMPCVPEDGQWTTSRDQFLLAGDPVASVIEIKRNAGQVRFSLQIPGSAFMAPAVLKHDPGLLGKRHLSDLQCVIDKATILFPLLHEK